MAITASQEIAPSLDAALATVVDKHVAAHRRMQHQARAKATRCAVRVARTRMERTLEGGVDDLKFLYPVLDNLPMIVFPVLHFTCAGAQVCVYGSPEVGRVIEVVRDYLVEHQLIAAPDDLLFAAEDPQRISLARSLRGATAPLGAGPGDAIVWSAGDVVLGYDVAPWLAGRDLAARGAGLVLHASARQRVFPDGTPALFLGNYYETMIVDGGIALDVKDPNLVVFTRDGLHGSLRGLDRLRRAKDESRYLPLFFRVAARALLGRRALPCLHVLRYLIRRRRGTLGPGQGLRADHFAALLSEFFGVEVRVGAEHADPFALRDCDTLEDVFGYYRSLLQGIVDEGSTREDGYRRLADYHPYAEHLYALSLRLRPLWDEIPLWRRWPEFISDRIATYNRHIQAALAAAGLAGGGGDPPIPAYFAGGTFVPSPGPGDDLAGTRAFLRDVYRPRFERSWAAHRPVIGSATARPAPAMTTGAIS